MKPHKFQALLEYARTHLNKKRCRTILVALACVVVFGTTYALILPAVTMTPELICDKPEHEHTADCYELELVCDNDDPDHEHDDSCYEEVLICGEEEHQHNEDCYAFPDEDEDTADGENAADDADSEEPAEEPAEDDAEEEPEAPAWADDLPDRTGNWAEDVLAIAQSQEGTDAARYGDWYTETYGADEDELDASAPFVAFCLYYAEVDEDALPQAGNADEWINTLEEKDLLSKDISAPGDLLFYFGEDDAPHVGIITDVDESDEEPVYAVLESGADGEVTEINLTAGDFNVLASAAIPENPDENGGSTEKPDEPDQPGDSDKNDSKSDSDSKDQDQSDADGDKSDEDKADQDGKDDANQDPEAPAEEPDTLPDVPKYAMSAADADKTLQVTVQMALCTEHDHLGSTLAKPRYQPGDEAQGTITVTTTQAEPAEDDTTVARVYLAFENNTGTTELPGEYTATSENGHKYTYLVEQIGDSNTYYFEIPRLHPGDTLTIPFAARYLVSTEHGGKASLWCTVTNGEEATQDKPEKVKTLTWESDAVELMPEELMREGKYGSKYTFKYNREKNDFINNPDYAKYIVQNSPLGICGSFHIVAFNEVRLDTDCNGNVLANYLYTGRDFGTRGYKNGEVTYIVHYMQIHGESDRAPNSMLVVGSDHTLGTYDNGNAITINGTPMYSNQESFTIMQDLDSSTPFIDLQYVKNEIRGISSMLALQPNNGVKEIIESAGANTKFKGLEIPDPDGAYYYNMSLERLDELSRNAEHIRLDGFKSDHDGSLIINVDCQNRAAVNLPESAHVFIDGVQQGTGEVTTFTSGKVIWNFINAKGTHITTGIMTGAVIAPGATVTIKSSLNGTVVADNVTVKTESHRSDFIGTTTPANLELQCKKLVDGKEPKVNQTFNFMLEKWNGNTWTEVEKRQNAEEWINFAPLSFQESDNGKTYWYRIRELTDGVEGYQCDKTQYLVKAAISKNGNKMEAQYTYYSAPSDYDGTVAPDQVKLTELEGGKSDMVFKNTTDDGAHTLPSTGGPGEWTIPSIGILLMAGSLLVVTKQRPQRKEDR